MCLAELPGSPGISPASLALGPAEREGHEMQLPQRGRQGIPQYLGALWSTDPSERMSTSLSTQKWHYPALRRWKLHHLLPQGASWPAFPQICQRCKDLIRIKFLQICEEKRHPATGMRSRERKNASVLQPSGTPIFFCLYSYNTRNLTGKDERHVLALSSVLGKLIMKFLSTEKEK